MRIKALLLISILVLTLAAGCCTKKAEPQKFDPQPVRNRAGQAVDETEKAGK